MFAPRRAGAGHLLRRADHVRPARREGRVGSDHREFGRALDHGRPALSPLFEGVLETSGEQAPGVDEPRRPRRRPAAGLPPPSRPQRGRALSRRSPTTSACSPRRPVPSRGRAHAGRRPPAQELRHRHLRLPRHLDHGLVPRRGDPPHQEAGGLRAGDLRVVGAASTARWWRVWSTKRSGRSCTASSSTMDCCARASARAWFSSWDRMACRRPSRWSTRARVSWERLKGVDDPEEKRKRIGNLFIEIFEEVSSKRGPFEFFAQGTLYPVASRASF